MMTQQNISATGVLLLLCILMTTGSTAATPVDTVPEYKTLTLIRIRDDIVRAINEPDRDPPPGIEIVTASSRGGAYYEQRRHVISIDERLYDLCIRGFGRDSLDALAAVIGHELAHWYLDHLFGSRSVSERWRQWVRTFTQEKYLRRESEADYFACICGRWAGYDPAGVMAELLECIYQEYKHPEELPGYLSLSDRKALAWRIEDYLKRLLPFFDAAEAYGKNGSR